MTRKESQVAKFIDFHGHNSRIESNSSEILELYSYSPGINDLPRSDQYFTVGIHPWSLQSESNIDEITDLLSDDNCIAVGEAGLDRSIDHPFSNQIRVFKQHIEYANESNSPLVIHCVKSLSDILRMHLTYKRHTPWALHDFNGNMNQIEQCHSKGIYTSLSSRFYKSKTAKIVNAVAMNKLNLDYIFFETDDNKEDDIIEIYTKFASIQGISVENLKARVCKNLQTFLGRDLTS